LDFLTFTKGRVRCTQNLNIIFDIKSAVCNCKEIVISLCFDVLAENDLSFIAALKLLNHFSQDC
jgi:hypothetical protein